MKFDLTQDTKLNYKSGRTREVKKSRKRKFNPIYLDCGKLDKKIVLPSMMDFFYSNSFLCEMKITGVNKDVRIRPTKVCYIITYSLSLIIILMKKRADKLIGIPIFVKSCSKKGQKNVLQMKLRKLEESRPKNTW